MVKFVSKKAQIESITIELNLDEIKTLQHILNNVGGDPITTPRKHAKNIQKLILDETGIGESGKNNGMSEGSIYFNKGEIKY